MHTSKAHPFPTSHLSHLTLSYHTQHYLRNELLRDPLPQLGSVLQTQKIERLAQLLRLILIFRRFLVRILL